MKFLKKSFKFIIFIVIAIIFFGLFITGGSFLSIKISEFKYINKYKAYVSPILIENVSNNLCRLGAEGIGPELVDGRAFYYCEKGQAKVFLSKESAGLNYFMSSCVKNTYYDIYGKEICNTFNNKVKICYDLMTVFRESKECQELCKYGEILYCAV